MNTYETLLTLAAFISSIVYVLYVCTVVKYRRNAPFNGSFFKLTLSMAGFDLLSLLILYFVVRFPHWGLFHRFYVANEGHPWFGKFMSFFGSYVFTGQTTSILILSINRYTAVWEPLLYKSWWSDWLKRAIAINWLAPLIYLPWLYWGEAHYVYAVCHMIDDQCCNGTAFHDRIAGGQQLNGYTDVYTFQQQLGNETELVTVDVNQVIFAWTLTSAQNIAAILTSAAELVFTFFLALANAALYIGIIRRLHKTRRQVKPMLEMSKPKTERKGELQQRRQKEKAEQKLSIAGFCIFLLFCVFLLLCVLNVSNGDLVGNMSAGIFMLSNDLLGYMNPYILLACSEATRQHFWAFLKIPYHLFF